MFYVPRSSLALSLTHTHTHLARSSLSTSSMSFSSLAPKYFGVWELWQQSAELLRITVGSELTDSADLDPPPESASVSDSPPSKILYQLANIYICVCAYEIAHDRTIRPCQLRTRKVLVFCVQDTTQQYEILVRWRQKYLCSASVDQSHYVMTEHEIGIL